MKLFKKIKKSKIFSGMREGITKICLYFLSSLQYHIFLQNKSEDKVLVYSVMPPEKTGMAPFALNTFSKKTNFIIITQFKYLFYYFKCLFTFNQFHKNIFSSYIEKNIIKTSKILSKIFVIGNSPHHKYSLIKAIETKEEENRYVYLGENFIMGAIIDFFQLSNNNMIEEFVRKYYGKDVKIENDDVYNSLKNAGIYGIKILIELTGIRNFIVFSENAIQCFKSEFTQGELSNININVISISVPDIESNFKLKKEYENKDYILVGSFGICGKLKSTEDIIEAVNKINKKGIKTKLLLAGYNTKEYLKSLDSNIDRNNIITQPHPDNKNLYNLMYSIDIAVQLRPSSHGEVSGCISELIALNKKVITTTGFVPNCVKEFCREVEPYIAPEKLADVIMTEVSKPNEYDYKKLKYLNFENCANEIFKAVTQK